jgi:NDP-sugar pyrophosphorylase family protein
MKTVVILAGGLGTRLLPYTLTIPKPLLPIGKVPILEIVIKQLIKHKFDRIVISIGYYGNLIKYHFGDGSKFGCIIEYVEELTPMGTAGSISLISNLPDKFLVMNGDLLTDFDFLTFFDSIDTSDAVASVALREVNYSIDYGVIELDESKFVSNYLEKPSNKFFVSMGIYVFNKKSLELLPKNRIDIPTFFNLLRQNGFKISGYVSECYWQDIGKIKDFEQANIDFEIDPERFI